MLDHFFSVRHFLHGTFSQFSSHWKWQFQMFLELLENFPLLVNILVDLEVFGKQEQSQSAFDDSLVVPEKGWVGFKILYEWVHNDELAPFRDVDSLAPYWVELNVQTVEEFSHDWNRLVHASTCNSAWPFSLNALFDKLRCFSFSILFVCVVRG